MRCIGLVSGLSQYKIETSGTWAKVNMEMAFMQEVIDRVRKKEEKENKGIYKKS